MSIDYKQLKIDDAAGHPNTGAFSIVAATAAIEWNAMNRVRTATVRDMFAYLLNKNHRTNSGTDTTYTPILGRLQMVAESAVGADPFGRGTNLNLANIHACKCFLLLLTSPHLSDFDFSDANLPYGFTEGSAAWGASHTTAIKALSENMRSYAAEKGYPNLSAPDLTYARAL